MEPHKATNLFDIVRSPIPPRCALLSNQQGAINDIEPVAVYAKTFVNNQMLHNADHDVEAHAFLAFPQRQLGRTNRRKIDTDCR